MINLMDSHAILRTIAVLMQRVNGMISVQDMNVSVSNV